MIRAPERRVPFPRELLAGDVDAAAARLVGAYLIRDGGHPRIGRIVEVEAYGGPEDAASHARFARSSRRAAMAAAPGHAYVYLVYGMHTCLNVVAGPAGRPAAVLLRAIAPCEGVDEMRAAIAAARSSHGRGARDPAAAGRRPDTRVAAGPALLAAAFGVDVAMTGADLCDPHGSLRLEVAVDAAGRPFATPDVEIHRSPRVGVAYAGEPWASAPRRLSLADDPAVSDARPPRSREG